MIIITNCTNYFGINTSYPNMTNENDNSTGNNCCIQQQNIDVTQRYHSDLQDSTAIALNITYSIYHDVFNSMCMVGHEWAQLLEKSQNV